MSSIPVDELHAYADLVLRAGVNLEQGQKLLLLGNVEHRELIDALAERAYACGAGAAYVLYLDEQVENAQAAFAPSEPEGSARRWFYAWLELVCPDDRTRILRSLTAAYRDEATWRDEYRLRRADGTYVWVQDTGVIVRDEDDRPARMLGTIRDVTREREAGLALEQAAELVEFHRGNIRRKLGLRRDDPQLGAALSTLHVGQGRVRGGRRPRDSRGRAGAPRPVRAARLSVRRLSTPARS